MIQEQIKFIEKRLSIIDKIKLSFIRWKQDNYWLSENYQSPDVYEYKIRIK